MHHTLAYLNTAVADATETDIAALSDGVVVIQNGHFLFQEDHALLYAFAGCASLQRARIITPKFRQITTPFIRPINSGLQPQDVTPVADFRNYPLVVRGLEELQLNAIQNSGGAASFRAVLGIDWGRIPTPAGEIYTLRGTGATAATAAAWSQTVVTWQDTLPTGKYAIMGLQVISTTCVAGRLILENTYPRPGCIGAATALTRSNKMFERGELGVWGYFTTTRMPLVEILCSAADATQEIYMDIIRVA